MCSILGLGNRSLNETVIKDIQVFSVESGELTSRGCGGGGGGLPICFGQGFGQVEITHKLDHGRGFLNHVKGFFFQFI